jgi:hypothetical protein
MRFEYSDGGRALAGFKGNAGDCVTRAIAIATGKPYIEVYNALNELAKTHERPGARKRKGKRSSARNGVWRSTYDRYLVGLGWQWCPQMEIGSTCRTHLDAAELPRGRLICRVSKHVVAVIDHVIHDDHDPSRNGTRIVYGYWRPPACDILNAAEPPDANEPE